MKGLVLAFSVQQGSGLISGDDEQRYKFLASSWKCDEHPTQGIRVDFDISPQGEALDIYLDISSPVGRGRTLNSKTRSTATIFAFFLGTFGAHKFYLGNQRAATIMLLVSLLGSVIVVPTLVMYIIGFSEFIIYLTKSDQEFHDIYVRGKREWF